MTTSRRTVVLVSSLVAVVTLFNLGKAVHIDDPTYLLIARSIAEEPLKPLSGEFVLSGATIRTFSTNQPPLLFYGFAVVMTVFGESELALHAFAALFSAAAIVFFYLLARRFCGSVALPLTATFCLGAAFLPAQNLMTDVPVVALWLGFFWLLCPELEGDKISLPRLAGAGTLAACACLIKYTSLILLPLLLLAAILRRQPKIAWALVIPLLALAGWSAFNFAELGRLHLFSRNTGALDPVAVLGRSRDWLVGLGALGPIALGALPWAKQHRRSAVLVLIATLAALLLFEVSVEEGQANPLLARLFFANGVLTLALSIVGMWRGSARLDRWLMLAWVAASAAFIVLFAPFMAMRHVLLAVPPILLGVGCLLEGAGSPTWRRAALASCCAIGLALGLSDWIYADAYRTQAASLRARFGEQAQIWYLGNWGWRWYAEGQGMQPYLPGSSKLEAGDLVVIPSIPAGPKGLLARDRVRVERFDQQIVPASPWTFVRTMRPAPLRGYYKYRFPGVPWALSEGRPLERFEVWRVRSS